MRTRALIVLLLFTLGLAAGACGGGDEGDTGASDTGGFADTGLVDTGLVETQPTEPEVEPAIQITVPGPGEVIGPQSPSARIEELQKALKALGFKISTDGQYGPKTVRAVKKFQRNHNLEADGLVGAKTARAINKALREKAQQAG